MKKYIKTILDKTFAVQVLASSTVDKLKLHKLLAEEFSFISNYPQVASEYMLHRNESNAQLKQDLFVLMETNFKKEGFFVEFGATDGVSLSNTFLLEKEFAWKGILAEPGKIWHESLNENRNCFIETDCVWSTSGERLIFKEVPLASLSTVEGFGENDNHTKSRSTGKTYEVDSISLNDLLKRYNAPLEIDYLSVDTEGTEYLILDHFNFNKYKIKIITVEHNYTPIREKIYGLLSEKGYKRIHEEFSQFDDWYIQTE